MCCIWSQPLPIDVITNSNGTAVAKDGNRWVVSLLFRIYRVSKPSWWLLLLLATVSAAATKTTTNYHHLPFAVALVLRSPFVFRSLVGDCGHFSHPFPSCVPSLFTFHFVVCAVRVSVESFFLSLLLTSPTFSLLSSSVWISCLCLRPSHCDSTSSIVRRRIGSTLDLKQLQVQHIFALVERAPDQLMPSTVF